ncbi:hypothetical protein Lcho_1774 [Leptothrix cholodnii SP-6]|uniref:Uncharacterized protein n=1 Tax=Leptothrix cholodnii (strain ATCC 51168 / LMG 8142 / SP-6) TaxID=395495 RepID=B1XZ22_LEPCP|nr:hypothetical protein [Leptothrix cholodnii]ACB34041.1 hypothetical protein Lcho_1774 [Leptothrix cholodnii SP-6]
MAAQRIESDWHDDSTGDGFELGRDYARHALTPPAEHLGPGNPVRQGWDAGRARFAQRTSPAGEHTRLWLQLRLQAWREGRHFELLSVTPNYLGQLATSHCPVTRRKFSSQPGDPRRGAAADAVIARLHDDAGYAAGHLATLSRVAGQARAERTWDESMQQAQRIEAAGGGQVDGLSGDAWRRLGVLLSFVTPLPHTLAARVPLLVLPPNRLHLRNPIQALQVLATRMLARSGWSARMPALLRLLPRGCAQQDFQRFFIALLARVIEGGQPTDPLRRRWALEDAWRDTEVQQLWWQFALQLDAEQAQYLMERAAEAGLFDQRVVLHSDEQSTDGWALDTRGYTVTACNAVADMPTPLWQIAASPARGVPIAAMARQLSLPWSQPVAGA